jgi:hypothetical protein
VIVSPGALSNEGLRHRTARPSQGDCSVEQQELVFDERPNVLLKNVRIVAWHLVTARKTG